jgi:hypothetical protein
VRTSSTIATPVDDAPSPARARGLRRARRRRAPCEPASWTPLPPVVDAVHVLALLTRVRAARIAAGEISAGRLYDVRAFKCVVAELGYLRTLTRPRTGGTIVTSMPQLVAGLARLHPAWTIEGDKFGDRDRHQRAVRRRLRDLDATGLIRWRIGVDVDGEDARTELELRPAPDITDEERALAEAALARWQARYGLALNTGSRTGIRNAAGHARPLSAGERQRRGIARVRRRAARVRVRSMTNSAPPFGAPASPENNLLARSANQLESPSACGARTGVRARQDDARGLRLTRHQPHNSAPAKAAISAVAETASLTIGGSGPSAGFAVGGSASLAIPPDARSSSSGWDEGALAERVAARLAAHEPVWDLIAVQARRRVEEVASWSVERGWPVGRLREAWVVWRYGSMCAAELGAAPAGRVQREDLTRLRRALSRYERHAAARPEGFPAGGGLAVLACIGAIAAERDARPQTLAFAIRAVDQLSRRMRAADTADDPRRRDRAAARARRRRTGAPGPIAFRLAPWPSWVALGADGDPLLEDGELVIAAREGIHAAPDRDDPSYLQTLRDAQLLAGLWPRAQADGRTTMAARQDYDVQTARRRARPGPYAPPTDRRARLQFADVRLAQLTGLPLQTIQRLTPERRDELLDDHERRRAEQRDAEHGALCARLADLDSSRLDRAGS